MIKTALRFAFSTGTLVALAGINTASADDAGLYDAPPPPDSAFVRVLNAAVSGGPAPVTLGGTSLRAAAASLTPYVIVKAGDLTVDEAGAQTTVTLKQGAFYTVAIGQSGARKLFDDAPLNDPAKSRVYFYNMSDIADLDLFVPAAKVNAIKEIDAGESQSVELKAPLQLDFVARSGDREIAAFSDVILKRRGTLSLIVFGKDGSYTGAMAVNSVDGSGS